MGYHVKRFVTHEVELPMPSPGFAEWMIVLLCVPGRTPEPAGILLLDPEGSLSVKLKAKLEVDDESISTVWYELSEDFLQKDQDVGGVELVRWLEGTASNVFRLSPRKRVEVGNLSETLQNLYREHVEN